MTLVAWLLACGSDPRLAGGDLARALRPGEVALGQAALANADLKVEALVPVPIGGQIPVPARLTLDPRQEARVAAVAAGTVERIEVRPGDAVQAGARLATVLSPDLGEAIGAHLAAAAKLATAKARRERAAALHRDGFASAAQDQDAAAELTVAAAEAEAAEERVRAYGLDPDAVQPGQHFSSRLAVRSPVAGQVLGVDAALGSSVSSGDALVHVGNLDELWLLVGVYEKDLAATKVGAPVVFTVDAYGDERFQGTIDNVGDWVDPVSRTLEVRVIVPNADHRLKPNMFAHARVSVGGDGGVGLVLPAAAVVEVDGRPCAFVDEGDGRFRAVPVRTEPLADGTLRVVDGLEAGARVVVGGAFTLASELGKAALEGE